MTTTLATKAPGQCPPWCNQTQAHSTCFDSTHFRLDLVSLSEHIHVEDGEIYVPTMGAMLRQRRDDQAPVITLAGHDDTVEDVLTLDEAEQLANLLAELVRVARAGVTRS